jgi:hypothetical protein
MLDYIMTGATPDEIWPLVRDFHYSKRMPSAIQHCFAVREPGGLFGDTGKPVAGCIFGFGANRNMPATALELRRLVRHPNYSGFISQLVAFGLQWMKKNTDCEFAFSYADTGQNHHGGIYQATNWKYVGLNKSQNEFVDENNNPVHKRTVSSKLGTARQDVVMRLMPNLKIGKSTQKHLYIFPLKTRWPKIAARHDWEALPYPKPDRV